MLKTLAYSTFSLTAAAGFASAATTTLYNASAGGAPAAQGYLIHYSTPSGGSETVSGAGTTYDSTSEIDEMGGYANRVPLFNTYVNSSFPSLDRTQGYTVSLDLKELSETHTSNDRSGVDLIVLSSDHVGVELSFWSNEIWAQSGADFKHAEGKTFNTQAASTTYDLSIFGSSYTLTANGVAILNGSLRDYSGHGYPYTLSNFLFLGDDTAEAQGAFSFSRLAVTTPEPALLGSAALSAALLLRRRPRLA